MLNRKPAWLKFPCLANGCLRLPLVPAEQFGLHTWYSQLLTPVWEPQQGTKPEMEAHFWVGGSVSTELCGVACAAFIISCIIIFIISCII